MTTFDRGAAERFVATNGRVLDWRRLVGGDVLAALDGFRNDDGGYGWGIEPDLRSPGSQPCGAMHAFEVLAELGRPTAQARALCDWLQSVTLADGGLPFVLPIDDPTGCAPWWAGADSTTSALQITAQVVANARLVARFDDGVAGHPWLATATAWCLDAVRAIDGPPHAYELLFAARMLAVVDGTDDLLDHLATFVPEDGLLPVAGGAEGEVLHPMKVVPTPTSRARRLYSDAALSADLDRLASGQRDDGGWTVDFQSYSPQAELEWRGYATVRAISLLSER
jgi:hypothetical protein